MNSKNQSSLVSKRLSVGSLGACTSSPPGPADIRLLGKRFPLNCAGRLAVAAMTNPIEFNVEVATRELGDNPTVSPISDQARHAMDVAMFGTGPEEKRAVPHSCSAAGRLMEKKRDECET